MDQIEYVVVNGDHRRSSKAVETCPSPAACRAGCRGGEEDDDLLPYFVKEKRYSVWADGWASLVGQIDGLRPR
jgi:hypothetical protein